MESRRIQRNCELFFLNLESDRTSSHRSDHRRNQLILDHFLQSITGDHRSNNTFEPPQIIELCDEFDELGADLFCVFILKIK